MYFIFTQVEVERHYRDNPFHNFRHCFCVAQMMYVLIHSCQLTQYFSNLELCSLITACICHDLDHPGLNNTYVIIVIQHIMMDGPNHLGTYFFDERSPSHILIESNAAKHLCVRSKIWYFRGYFGLFQGNFFPINTQMQNLC